MISRIEWHRADIPIPKGRILAHGCIDQSKTKAESTRPNNQSCSSMSDTGAHTVIKRTSKGLSSSVLPILPPPLTEIISQAPLHAYSSLRCTNHGPGIYNILRSPQQLELHKMTSQDLFARTLPWHTPPGLRWCILYVFKTSTPLMILPSYAAWWIHNLAPLEHSCVSSGEISS